MSNVIPLSSRQRTVAPVPAPAPDDDVPWLVLTLPGYRGQAERRIRVRPYPGEPVLAFAVADIFRQGLFVTDDEIFDLHKQLVAAGATP